MRWENLQIDAEDGTQLPGYRDPARVRRFDAPEALDMRFYEVRAKSALNRVPEASRMPFRWTVNPYRGCSHACVYCLGGDTPILMTDGTTRALCDLRKGDTVYGTVRDGFYRRYTQASVLAKWSTVKRGYRVTLADGTEIVASDDHRFLTGRGWKHVTGAQCGSARRPHLTLNDVLMGSGQFAAGPEADRDYRQGYLCGLIRGDGHLGSYSYDRPGRSHGRVYRFRLALTDREALQRAADYLRGAGVPTGEFVFAGASERRREMTAIRTQARAHVAAIENLVAWPDSPIDQWRKGFLAGIFAAEGSSSRGSSGSPIPIERSSRGSSRACALSGSRSRPSRGAEDAT